MDKLKSEGECFYCKESFAGSGISRHLSTHLKSIEKENLTKKKSYHIKVVGEKLYFLHLLIDENSSLEDLDYFLKRIWLECCGHLSSFEIKGARQVQNWMDYSDQFGLDMNTKIGDLFKKGLKLDYEYDFGSTTYLKINVLNEYFIQSKEDILLLSRNAPLKIICDTCKEKPAQVACLLWHDKETMFCNSCGEIHAKQCSDFSEYSWASIINSPRMGVCAYSGGSIDTERDGVWQG
jgi:hypothetical protein